MQHFNLNKLRWDDGYGLIATGASTATALYTLRSQVREKGQMTVKHDFEVENNAMNVRRNYKENIISKNSALGMLTRLGVDPGFLGTGDLKRIQTVQKPKLSVWDRCRAGSVRHRPFGSISSANYDCSDLRFTKSQEFAQTAEAALPSRGISSDHYLGQEPEKASTVAIILIGGFLAGAAGYVFVVTKLRNSNWFKKNVTSKESLIAHYDERLDALENNQKKLLETQDEILSLLKQNKN